MEAEFEDHLGPLEAICDITKPGIKSEEVMNKYKTWADRYDSDMEAYQGYNGPRLVADEVLSLYPTNKDIYILDAAAGTGNVGVEMRKRGFNTLDALDACSEMLEKAKEKNIYKRLICDFMGPNRLDIEDNTYDAIVTTGSFVFGHVKGDCFDELIRITKPGGHIVLAMAEKVLEKTSKTAEFHGLEQQMTDLESAGKWMRITQIHLPDYATWTGIMFVFQII